MEEERRIAADVLIKKVLKEKSFKCLTEQDKTFLFDVYEDDIKVASSNYREYLLLPESEKLVNLLVLVLKVYIGNWHVTTEEMNEISEYIKNISKVE
jgi:hypothetical protein